MGCCYSCQVRLESLTNEIVDHNEFDLFVHWECLAAEQYFFLCRRERTGLFRREEYTDITRWSTAGYHQKRIESRHHQLYSDWTTWYDQFLVLLSHLCRVDVYSHQSSRDHLPFGANFQLQRMATQSSGLLYFWLWFSSSVLWYFPHAIHLMNLPCLLIHLATRSSLHLERRRESRFCLHEVLNRMSLILWVTTHFIAYFNVMLRSDSSVK